MITKYTLKNISIGSVKYMIKKMKYGFPKNDELPKYWKFMSMITVVICLTALLCSLLLGGIYTPTPASNESEMAVTNRLTGTICFPSSDGLDCYEKLK